VADINQISLENQIKTIFEDQHLLVLSKPAGLLSQGDISGEENLVDLLRVRFGRNYVGLVHRLDRNTTGLMVVAKRSKSAERLTAQLTAGELVRKYHAILWGSFDGEERWEHWLLKNEKTNESKVVAPKTPSAKVAVLKATAVKKLIHPQTGDPLTFTKFDLETGRSHQIRAQSAAMHHPLIGDSKYGTAKSLALFSRPALHSCFLSFFHPISRENLSFEERYSADIEHAFSTQLE
jgi:23S rRNA pseudouridine1911/1915/1917 synthase